MVLLAQMTGQHIAHVQGVDIRGGGVVHGRLDRVPGQVADRGIPILADLYLSNANN